MNIIRYMQDGEIIQLGIERKELFLKWGELLNPIKLGTLEDIQKISSQDSLELDGNKTDVPEIIKKMSKGMSKEVIKISKEFTDKEFYNDFIEDFRQMSTEGSLILIGEFNEWD